MPHTKLLPKYFPKTASLISHHVIRYTAALPGYGIIIPIIYRYRKPEQVNEMADIKEDKIAKAHKKTVRGAATSLVVLSLLTGLAFQSPGDILQDQTDASSFTPTPVVLDIDEFVNAPVDDDEDQDGDEQKTVKLSLIARFRQAVLSLPKSVRLLLTVPLWAAGTAILTVISFLWNTLFASPLGAFIASLAMGFAILLGLFTVTAKALFPDIPLRKLLSKRNLLILAGLALLLSVFDAVAPVYWHSYPLAAALVKLVLGGTVIGYLAHRTGRLFHPDGITGLPPATV